MSNPLLDIKIENEDNPLLSIDVKKKDFSQLNEEEKKQPSQSEELQLSGNKDIIDDTEYNSLNLQSNKTPEQLTYLRKYASKRVKETQPYKDALKKELSKNTNNPDYNWVEYLKDVGSGLGKGSYDVLQSIYDIPSLAYNVAALPQNAIVSALGKKELQVKSPEILSDNVFTESAKSGTKMFEKQIDLDDKPILDEFKDGNYGKAFQKVGIEIAKSLPYSASIAASGGTIGAVTKVTPMVAGTYSAMVLGASQKNAALRDSDSDEWIKMANVIPSGALEGLTERFGTLKIVNDATRLVKEVGKDKAKEVLASGFKNALKESFDKAKPLGGSMVDESWTELANLLGSNAVDKVTTNPEKKIFDANEFLTTALVSAGSGGLMHSAIVAPKTIQDAHGAIISAMGKLPKTIDVTLVPRAAIFIAEKDKLQKDNENLDGVYQEENKKKIDIIDSKLRAQRLSYNDRNKLLNSYDEVIKNPDNEDLKKEINKFESKYKINTIEDVENKDDYEGRKSFLNEAIGFNNTLVDQAIKKDIGIEANATLQNIEQKVAKQESNDVNLLHQKAKEDFDLTENIDRGLFILNDGSVIDRFSENGKPAMLNHENIEKIGTTKDDFIKSGAIRISDNGNGIELSAIPTDKQIKILKDHISKKDGQVNIDFNYDGNTFNIPKNSKLSTSQRFYDIQDLYEGKYNERIQKAYNELGVEYNIKENGKTNNNQTGINAESSPESMGRSDAGKSTEGTGTTEPTKINVEQLKLNENELQKGNSQDAKNKGEQENVMPVGEQPTASTTEPTEKLAVPAGSVNELKGVGAKRSKFESFKAKFSDQIKDEIKPIIEQKKAELKQEFEAKRGIGAKTKKGQEYLKVQPEKYQEVFDEFANTIEIDGQPLNENTRTKDAYNEIKGKIKDETSLYKAVDRLKTFEDEGVQKGLRQTKVGRVIVDKETLNEKITKLKETITEQKAVKQALKETIRESKRDLKEIDTRKLLEVINNSKPDNLQESIDRINELATKGENKSLENIQKKLRDKNFTQPIQPKIEKLRSINTEVLSNEMKDEFKSLGQDLIHKVPDTEKLNAFISKYNKEIQDNIDNELFAEPLTDKDYTQIDNMLFGRKDAKGEVISEGLSPQIDKVISGEISDPKEIITVKRRLNRLLNKTSQLMREGQLKMQDAKFESENTKLNELANRLNELDSGAIKEKIIGAEQKYKSDGLNTANQQAKFIPDNIFTDARNKEIAKLKKALYNIQKDAKALENLSVNDVDVLNDVVLELQKGNMPKQLYDLNIKLKIARNTFRFENDLLKIDDFFSRVKGTSEQVAEKFSRMSLQDMGNASSLKDEHAITERLFGIGDSNLKEMENAKSIAGKQMDDIIGKIQSKSKDPAILDATVGIGLRYIDLYNNIKGEYNLKKRDDGKITIINRDGKETGAFDNIADAKNAMDTEIETLLKDPSILDELKNVKDDNAKLSDSPLVDLQKKKNNKLAYEKLLGNKDYLLIKNDGELDGLLKEKLLPKEYQLAKEAIKAWRDYADAHVDMQAIVAERKGLEFGQRKLYYPAPSAEGRKSGDIDLQDFTGTLNEGYIPESGSSFERLPGNRYRVYGFSDVYNRYSNSLYKDYYLNPVIKEQFGILRNIKNKSGGNEKIERNVKALSDNLKTRWITENQRMPLLSTPIQVGNIIVDVGKIIKGSLKVSRDLLLKNPARLIAETAGGATKYLAGWKTESANMSKKETQSLDHLMADQFMGAAIANNAIDYRYKLGEFEYGNDKRLLSKLSNDIFTYSDKMIVSPYIWKDSFYKRFKEKTGERFDAIKFKNDFEYSERFNEEVDDAIITANDIVSQNLLQSNSYSGKSALNILPGFKDVKRNTIKYNIATAVMPFSMNETSIARQSIKDLIYGLHHFNTDKEFAIRGTRKLSAILASNMVYTTGMATTWLMSRLLANQIQGDDKEKEEVLTQLNRIYSTEGMIGMLIGNGLSLAVGGNGIIGKTLLSAAFTLGGKLYRGQEGTEWNTQIDGTIENLNNSLMQAAYFRIEDPSKLGTNWQFTKNMLRNAPVYGTSIINIIESADNVMTYGRRAVTNIGKPDLEKEFISTAKIIETINILSLYKIANPNAAGFRKYIGEFTKDEQGLNENLLMVKAQGINGLLYKEGGKAEFMYREEHRIGKKAFEKKRKHIERQWDIYSKYEIGDPTVRILNGKKSNMLKAIYLKNLTDILSDDDAQILINEYRKPISKKPDNAKDNWDGDPLISKEIYKEYKKLK